MSKEKKEKMKKPSVRIRILEDTVCRNAEGNLVKVKKGQEFDADVLDGPGLVRAGKAEVLAAAKVNEPKAKV